MTQETDTPPGAAMEQRIAEKVAKIADANAHELLDEATGMIELVATSHRAIAMQCVARRERDRAATFEGSADYAAAIATALRSLSSRIREMERDAARWRAIRARRVDLVCVDRNMGMPGPQGTRYWIAETDAESYRGETADVAIDAAITSASPETVVPDEQTTENR